MAVYDTGINRGAPPYGTDALVPEPLSADIIQMLPEYSSVLKMAQPFQMSTKTQRMPVLDALPTAYFVNGDQGLKQTSAMAWKNVNLVAEEVACIVPIPDSYLSDTNIPLWDQLKPRMVEAIARVIDGACLFGVNKPITWSPALVPAAIAAGNTVVSNSADLPASIAQLAENVALDGYTNIDGWLIRPGYKWRLLRVRSTGSGEPIYVPDLQHGRGGLLYGYPLEEVANGAWDASVADLLLGDWTMAILATRQDITFKMFDQGVIVDDAGKVIWSAMQNDGVAMRVVARFAWATASPVTNLQPNSAARYPFGVLTRGTSSS